MRKPCTVVVNTRNGHIITPFTAPSIAEGVRRAKESAGFAYRVFVGHKMVRSGYCDPA